MYFWGNIENWFKWEIFCMKNKISPKKKKQLKLKHKDFIEGLFDYVK